MFGKFLLAASTVLSLGSAPAMAAPKVMKYAHFQPAREDQPMHAAALNFKACMEQATSGSVTVQIFPAGQLGSATNALEGLKFGTVEMVVSHDGGISSVYRPFDVFAIPYLFPDHATAYKVLDGKFGKDFADEMLKQTGIRLLAYADNGIRHFTNSKHPIKTPADLKGLKIRVQPAPVFLTMIEALGGSASAIDWGELPAALSQGTVDGQENSVTNIMAGSLYQSQKYATLDGHVYSLHAYLVSDTFYQSLTDTEKKAIDDCVIPARDIHRDMTRAQDLSAQKVLTGVGMEVYVPTAAEIEQFRSAAQPTVVSQLKKSAGEKWVDGLLQAVKEAKGQ